MNIITIVTDSLGMIRPRENTEDDNILYKDLYAYKLQCMLGGDYHIILNGHRSLTSNELLEEQFLFDQIINNQSEYLIFHFGICDCAPRIISPLESLLIKIFNHLHLNFISKRYISLKSKHRFFFTKHFPANHVSSIQFETNINKLVSIIKEKTNVKKIFFINIAETNLRNKSRSYNFSENIIKYNNLIKKIEKKDFITIVDLYTPSKSDNEKFMLIDGIHITQKAHDLVAEQIYKEIIS